MECLCNNIEFIKLEPKGDGTYKKLYQCKSCGKKFYLPMTKEELDMYD